MFYDKDLSDSDIDSGALRLEKARMTEQAMIAA